MERILWSLQRTGIRVAQNFADAAQQQGIGQLAELISIGLQVAGRLAGPVLVSAALDLVQEIAQRRAVGTNVSRTASSLLNT